MDRDYIRRLREELLNFAAAGEVMADTLKGQLSQDHMMGTCQTARTLALQLGRLMLAIGEQESGIRIKPDDLYTRAEVAAYFKVTKKTLERWRAEGRGPECRRVGLSVYYKGSDIIDALEVGRM